MEKPKIVFSTQAASQMQDQAMVDEITNILEAVFAGQELPDGVEISAVEGFNEDDAAEILEANSHLPDADLARLKQALTDGDTDAVVEILSGDQPNTH